MGTGALLQGHAIVVQGTLLCYVMGTDALLQENASGTRFTMGALLQGHASGTRYAVVGTGALLQGSAGAC